MAFDTLSFSCVLAQQSIAAHQCGKGYKVISINLKSMILQWEKHSQVENIQEASQSYLCMS